MGIMESLGFGHPHEEDHSAPVVEAPGPTPPMESGEAVATAATTGETTESVEPAHMDMAGAGPATVDLSNMPVHPAETSGEATDGSDVNEGEVPQTEAVSVTVEGGESSETESAPNETETAVSVNAGEFTTAVPPASVENDSPTVDISSGNNAGVDTSTQTEGEMVKSTDTGQDASDSALDQLAAWQKSDAVGGVDAGPEDTPKADDAEVVVAPEVTQTEDDVTTQPEAVEVEERADDFAAKLEADAADEVAAIDAEVAKAQPEIHAMGGEIATEEPELPANTEKTEKEPAAVVEDAPFPAPPVELESTETSASVEDVEPSQEQAGTDPSEIVGGGDVHLDRAEYVVPESDTEKTEAPGDGAEKAEVVDIAAVRENIAKTRKVLDELEESLGKAA
jgi:hypothetical protein